MQTQTSYVDALEAELAKMMMFKNELPLSIHLISRAIDSCRRRLLLASGGVHRPHACDALFEETHGYDFEVYLTRPVLEFIPMNKLLDGDCLSVCKEIRGSDGKDESEFGKKSDWLSSTQLWNKSPDLPSNYQDLVTSDELENLEDKCKSWDDKKLRNLKSGRIGS